MKIRKKRHGKPRKPFVRPENEEGEKLHIPSFLDGSPLADALHGKPKRIATPA